MDSILISSLPKVLPYKYIIIIAMLFITIDLSSVSVAYKMVSLNSLLEILSGATFIFPITYCLGDIVTEVYGYKMARNLIWLSLCLQFVFAVLVTLILYLPAPGFWKNDDAYFVVFGSVLRFVLAGTLANLTSNFANIYIVSKLKIPMQGKYFWFRSILSTIASGFIMVLIVIIAGFSGKEINLYKTWIMFKSTFSLEIIYSLLLVLPAAFIARFLKQSERVDVYDYHTNFNPFYFH